MKNILIVDDTKTNIDLLIAILTEYSYNIFVATNGQTALEIINESNIDLVLLDIMMPEMDGYEVCEIIRQNPLTRELPVVFLTAKSQEDDIEKAYEVGGNDYITKPFKEKELIARIEMQLQIKNHNKLLKETMIQQSKMAQMGEMIDSIAHQWKQPINIISLNTQLLKIDFQKNKVDNNYINTFSQNISLQIEHLINTLDEFRSFFRPTNKLETFNVKKAVEKVLILLDNELQRTEITININEISPYILHGNLNEFKHIIINLINNSKDAFFENKIKDRKITISIDGNNQKIEILDNAGGIDNSIIDKIFDIHYSTKKQGTGMGLYMSKQIANKMNLDFKVENIENGAKFILQGY